MARFLTALGCYAACAFFLYAAYVTPEWETLSHGFPVTDRDYIVAGMVAVAMAAKLLGHLFLLSTSRAR
jgi:hypothetical protein